MKSKAFTLIELLVVIAIIGLLSSIVLASLNNAKEKAKDAKIKTLLSQMMISAELYYSDNGTHDGLCGPLEEPGILYREAFVLSADSTTNLVCDDTG